jgi:hypothetical protein
MMYSIKRNMEGAMKIRYCMHARLHMASFSLVLTSKSSITLSPLCYDEAYYYANGYNDHDCQSQYSTHHRKYLLEPCLLCVNSRKYISTEFLIAVRVYMGTIICMHLLLLALMRL